MKHRVSGVSSCHLQRKGSNFLPDRYDRRRWIVVLLRVQMTRLQLEVGPQSGVRPLAGIIKGVLDRRCVGGKQVLAHCLIKLSSGNSSKNINSGGGCCVISFTSNTRTHSTYTSGHAGQPTAERSNWSISHLAVPKSAIKWSCSDEPRRTPPSTRLCCRKHLCPLIG